MLDTLLSFFLDFWGDIFSLLGAALTVLFSWNARKSAHAAEAASSDARVRVASADWIFSFGEIIALIDQIIVSLDESKDFKSGIMGCIKVKTMIAVSHKSAPFIIGSEIEKKVSRSPTIFSQISDQLAKATDHLEQLEIQKLRRILSDQRDIYAIALDMAKKHASGEQNVK